MHELARLTLDRQLIRFGEGIGWAFDLALMSCTMQDGTGHRRFACAEVTVEVNDETSTQDAR